MQEREWNTALGVNALSNPAKSGRRNTAIGFDALRSSANGEANTAVGFQTLRNLTTGNYNIALGERALTLLTSGAYNTAIGYNSMSDGVVEAPSGTNTVGVYNTAIGASTLRSNTRGGYNTAVGADALRRNTTGNHNTAIGTEALTFNTTGIDNVAVGTFALGSTTTGDANVAVGFHALEKNTTGQSNVAIGFDAANALTTGDQNIAIGYRALGSNTEGGRNVAIGTYAGRHELQSDKLYINNRPRANSDDDKSMSLLYGTFADDPLHQTLHCNADYLRISGGRLKFPTIARPDPDPHTLDDYEEGTWTPGDDSGARLALTSSGSYTKIGRLVTAMGYVKYPANSNAAWAKLNGLPFAVSAGPEACQAFVSFTSVPAVRALLPNNRSRAMSIFSAAGTGVSNAALSDGTLYFTAIYTV